MPAKVLLISTNRCVTPDAVFPLGLACLDGALRQAGYQTRWLDQQAQPQTLAEVLREFRPDFVGVSLRNIDDVLILKKQTYFNNLAEVCATIRHENPCPIIVGGSGFSVFPKKLLDVSGADFGIQGEGETSLLALLHALREKQDYSQIPGLVYRRDNATAANPLRCQPGPCEQLVHRPPEVIQYYLSASGMLNLQTQRGCAHHCCYCTYPVIEGRTHRSRPPAQVAEEMAQLQAAGAKYVFIVDSIFNSSVPHVERMCEAILQRGVKLPWGCFLRPQGLTPPLMALMARAGLTHIEFGSDSFCDQVLKAYAKRLTFADIAAASEAARSAKVDFCHFLIAGGPGETYDTLETGFQNSLALQAPAIMSVVGMRIYPDTALHRRALQEGQTTPDADLLQPTYYLAPGLTPEGVFDRLRQFAQKSPNWIVGDATPEYARLVQRLRSRGVMGPLWSYFAVLQRLAPVTHPVPAA